MHLFFQCHFSKPCFKQIKEWLQIRITLDDLGQLVRRIKGGNISKFQMQAILASIDAIVYSVWHSRNLVYWEQHVLCINKVVKQVKSLVKASIYAILPKKITVKNQAWCLSL